MENYLQNIVCVSNTTWEGFYTKSTVQLLSLIAKNNKVLFVEYPFTIKDLVMSLLGKGRAPVARMLGTKKRLVTKKTAFNTSVYHLVVPPMLPFAAFKSNWLYNLLLSINAKIFSRTVRRSLRKLKMDAPTCINAYNSIYGLKLKGKLKEVLHLFYCYDGPDILRYGDRAVQSDQKFTEISDGVIVTSDYLKNTMKHLNSNIKVVKNGVDFKLFNKETKTDVLTNKTKKVGYIGSIDHRFDLETVEHAIQNLPEYEFEFVGDQMNKKVAQQLQKYSNVTFLPPVQAHEVPALLKQCDVGLIPYICSDYTKNIYPLKINEYLSVGVPVVLTSFANLPEFKNIVSFTFNKEEFCNAIDNEIKNDTRDKITERIKFAEQTSWENRAILFEKVIKNFRDKKLKN
ncbi:glycosyltransferase [Maribellus maritimus]|uniref:glycosyltransferase n=1 Tax=Maribellus maritimus TaxID=2870838 RepID=UPI001EEB12B5|nr:glycosyltransferase [Maribellus maritimus]MCG6186908.1 glycosyltransferase [Maribellus maritimus]